MTPQHQTARLKWATNINKHGQETDTHRSTINYGGALESPFHLPYSASHRGPRAQDTQTLPNGLHITTSRWLALFCADEEESFHPWQFCPVRWEAEKIRREIERRHPRPFRTITFETQEPHESGTLRNCRYLVYSLA